MVICYYRPARLKKEGGFFMMSNNYSIPFDFFHRQKNAVSAAIKCRNDVSRFV